MIKAVIFDFFGVLEERGHANQPLLDYIKQNLAPKYKLGIISNSSGGWLGSVLSESDANLFEQIVLSGKIGLAKPQTEIFEHAAKELGVEPQQCVFVDDSPMHCLGAQDAGMQAILYENFEQFKRDLEELLPASTDN